MQETFAAPGAEVRMALDEDIGAGDLTAALIPSELQARARLIAKQDGVLAGQAWFDRCFALVDAGVVVAWHAHDGARFRDGDCLCEIAGSARSILTAERSALNFLQCLSGTATKTARYVEQVAGTQAVILDTRKTLPGLRHAQKYAVRMGGGRNHRMGLHDMVLIKENHIAACGSIAAAVVRSRSEHPGMFVEVETESLAELEQAIAAGADRIMLDDFSLAQIGEAVRLAAGRCPLEVSGSVSLETIREIALTGVDYISVGALTKNVEAVDLSLRLDPAD